MIYSMYNPPISADTPKHALIVYHLAGSSMGSQSHYLCMMRGEITTSSQVSPKMLRYMAQAPVLILCSAPSPGNKENIWEMYPKATKIQGISFSASSENSGQDLQRNK